MIAAAQPCAVVNDVMTVQRGLQVLRAFRCQRTALSNAELVRRTGLAKATVSRLTTTLMQVGYLRHAAGSARFELAAASLAIGEAFLSASDMLRIADPLLQDLADRLNMSAALATAEGTDMLYLGYRAGQHVKTLRMGIGSMIPMGITAVGRAYLWALPAQLRQPLLDKLLQSAGAQAAQLEREILSSFSELDATGACLVHGSFQRGAWAMARAVLVGRDGMVMSLSCGSIAAAGELDLVLERQRVAPILREATVRLEGLTADCASVRQVEASAATRIAQTRSVTKATRRL